MLWLNKEFLRSVFSQLSSSIPVEETKKGCSGHIAAARPLAQSLSHSGPLSGLHLSKLLHN